MLIVKNKRFVKRHTVGGSGIFDTVSNFFKHLVTSNAARSVASNLSKVAATDLGKSAIGAAKTVGKELAASAISTAKDLAIDRGKRLIDRAAPKVLKPANIEAIKKLTGIEPNTPVITQKSKDILSSLINGVPLNQGASESFTNINKLMMGQGMNSNAIRIQDLVRQMNGNAYGSGLRLA